MSYTEHHLYFDELAVGQEWESPGRTITESDIVNFAGLSGDFNPIHIDHEYCKKTPFRRPIAHGLLGLAVGSGISLNSPPVRTLAFIALKEWSFKEPIFMGDTVRVRSKVLSIEPRSRGRRAVVTWQKQMLNQEGRIVQEGVSVTLVEGKALHKNQATDQEDG